MFDCVIVGAGPGGLVATKELLEAGVTNVICLEKSHEIGGIFAGSYDGLYLTSSAAFSMFSDHWIGDDEAHSFWTKKRAVRYWASYAETFGVTQRIQFGADVAETAQAESGDWQITLTSGELIKSRRLVVATGNNDVPTLPEWHGLATQIQTLHARNYKNATAFAGKRVVVVGGGESASDIALEVSKVATQCWVSLRNGTGWVVPRMRNNIATDMSTHRGIWTLPRRFGSMVTTLIIKHDMRLAQTDPEMAALVALNKSVPSPKGIWGTYGTKSFALPEAIANHNCCIVDGIAMVEDAGRTLVTNSGRILSDVDTIIFCTGYSSRVHILPAELRDCDPRGLFKHMIDPNHGDRLAWIGFARPAFGSQFPIMEMQARYWALIVSGQASLPDNAAMMASIAADKASNIAQFGATAERVRGLTDYFRYIDDLATLIGCMPRFWQTLFLRPRLWLHLVYGPAQATQFRLWGPGSKPKQAREILRKLPVSKFNHVVRIGLLGRIRFALSGFWRHDVH